MAKKMMSLGGKHGSSRGPVMGKKQAGFGSKLGKASKGKSGLAGPHTYGK